MKTITKSSSKAKVAILLSLLTFLLSAAEARSDEEFPTVEIQKMAQVVSVKWAKPFAKSNSLWIRMRLSKSRFTDLPDHSHLHMEIYDKEGKLLKTAYRKITPADFRRTPVGPNREQTIHYNTGLNADADIAKIVIQGYQQEHDHNG